MILIQVRPIWSNCCQHLYNAPGKHNSKNPIGVMKTTGVFAVWARFISRAGIVTPEGTGIQMIVLIQSWRADKF